VTGPLPTDGADGPMRLVRAAWVASHPSAYQRPAVDEARRLLDAATPAETEAARGLAFDRGADEAAAYLARPDVVVPGAGPAHPGPQAATERPEVGDG